VKIVSIVGARPEFVQAAMVSRTLRRRHDEVLIHTGQHYDDLMSDVFFRELSLPQPDANLGVGPFSSVTAQTGEILARLEPELRRMDPDLVLVRGDTTSTLAGALAARQGLFPVAHIEAGMRSHDPLMMEEINRVVADHIAELTFVVGDDERRSLASEGITRGVFAIGDVMLDTWLATVERMELRQAEAPAGFERRSYDLLTVHRAENTDDPGRLRGILAGLEAAPRPVLFPLHPRTRERIAGLGMALPAALRPCAPLGYLDMLRAELHAERIITDSGGVQREAYWGEVPCLVVREATEWTGMLATGWNQLVGWSSERIAQGLRTPFDRTRPHPPVSGDGHASERLAAVLEISEVQALVKERRGQRMVRTKVQA
jgi:UDP-GlcNAc3NAcA epimerase